MTVGELVLELQKVPQNLQVEIQTRESGESRCIMQAVRTTTRVYLKDHYLTYKKAVFVAYDGKQYEYAPF